MEGVSMDREDIFEFVIDTFDIKPDYPWEKFPDYAALRHKENQKWFGLIMDVTADKIGLLENQKIDILNLKVREEFMGSLRKKDGFYQAYHMDKTHWITINLAEIESVKDIEELIIDSFELTS